MTLLCENEIRNLIIEVINAYKINHGRDNNNRNGNYCFYTILTKCKI